MKKLATAAAGLTALTLAGCQTMTPAEQAAMNAEAQRIVTCTEGPDCAVKWGRALQWTLANSSFKIQTQSDSLIQTMGPLPNDPRPAFVVSKIPQGDGKDLIDLKGGCDNLFGCIPSLTEARASFVRAVTGE